MSLDWKLVRDWLVKYQVVPETSPVNQPGADLVDLASILKDGYILCSLVNRLSPQSIRKLHKQPQLQFLCYENIQNFLDACAAKFNFKETDLFAPDDLIYGSNFVKILGAIDKLSKSPQAVALNYSPIFDETKKRRPPATIPKPALPISASPTATRANQPRPAPHQQQQQLQPPSPVDEFGYGGDQDDIYEQLPNKLDSLKSRPTPIPSNSSLGEYEDNSYGNDIYDDLENFQKSRKAKPTSMGKSMRVKKPPVPTSRPSTQQHSQHQQHQQHHPHPPQQQQHQQHQQHRSRASVAINQSGIPNLPEENKRARVINELINTEALFVTSLEMILECFYTPLVDYFDEPTMKVLFSNLPKLLETHSSLLDSMICSLDECEGDNIAASLQEHKEDLLVYGPYCSNLPDAIRKLQEINENADLSRVLLDIQQNSGQRFRLADLLNVPMQRILKYPLLLTELLKASPTHEHPQIQLALNAMQEVATFINDAKRDKEYMALAQSLTTMISDYKGPDILVFGKLIHDGDLTVRTEQDKKPKARYVFLFQSAMIICSLVTAKKYKYKYTISFNDSHVEDVQPIAGYSMHCWSLRAGTEGGANCMFSAKTQETKKLWLGHLRKIVQDSNEKDKDKQKGARHFFKADKWITPQTCVQCNSYIWGEGLCCQVCSVYVHVKCVGLVNAHCSDTRVKTSEGPKKSQTVAMRGIGASELQGMIANSENGHHTIAAPRRANLQPDLMSLFTDMPTVSRARSRSNPDSMKEPPGSAADMCVAKFNHEGERPDDLSFSAGARIKVLDKKSDTWWKGLLNGKEGYFPASFVELVDAASGANGGSGTSNGTSSTRGVSVLPTASAPASGSGPNAPASSASAKRTSVVITPAAGGIKVQASSPPPSAVASVTRNGSTATESWKNVSWFHGALDKNEAHDLLINQPVGTFLVRESASSDGYTLSLTSATGIKHIRIKSNAEGNAHYIAEARQFKSIPDLIATYRRESLAQHFSLLDFCLKSVVPKARRAAVPAPTVPIAEEDTEDKYVTASEMQAELGAGRAAFNQRRELESAAQQQAMSPSSSASSLSSVSSTSSSASKVSSASKQSVGSIKQQQQQQQQQQQLLQQQLQQQQQQQLQQQLQQQQQQQQQEQDEGQDPLTPPDSATPSSARTYPILYDYTANANDEIHLVAGGEIEVIETYPDGWARGRVIGTDDIGLFPLSYCEYNEADASAQGDENACGDGERARTDSFDDDNW